MPYNPHEELYSDKLSIELKAQSKYTNLESGKNQWIFKEEIKKYKILSKRIK